MFTNLTFLWEYHVFLSNKLPKLSNLLLIYLSQFYHTLNLDIKVAYFKIFVFHHFLQLQKLFLSKILMLFACV